MSKAYENYKNKSKIIVDAAKKLFLSKGFSHTTMDEVAKEASVTKQTVYRYFPSKINLFEEVMKSSSMQIKRELGMHLDYNLDLRSALINYGIEYMKFHLEDDIIGVYKLMVAESGNAEVSKAFRESGPNESFKAFIDFLKIRVPEIDDYNQKAYFFINLLLSARTAVIIGRRPNLNDKEIEHHVVSVVDFFINAIR